MTTDVVITGMSWSTIQGNEVDEVWERLCSGNALMSAQTGVRTSDASFTDRQTELTVDVVGRALISARIFGQHLDATLISGVGYGPYLDEPPGPEGVEAWLESAAAQMGFRQRPILLSSACCSGSDAIALGGMLISSGTSEICVCGAVDVLTPGKLRLHEVLGTLSPTELRAFDINHDGTTLGEGGAYLVIESRAHAIARGAQILGVLRGWGASVDSVSATAPDPSGAGVALAVRLALKRAELAADEIAVVNLHGSGTPLNDEAEAEGMRSIFSHTRQPPVAFATKGFFGHLLGATGAVETVATICAVNSLKAPPVPALASALVGFPLLLSRKEGGELLREGVGININLAFGGCNTCLVISGRE